MMRKALDKVRTPLQTMRKALKKEKLPFQAVRELEAIYNNV
ncbi:hypothetical protein [Lysinibacillus sp.]|nr:hypothetical protein [Lysinibacillus sp.]